MTTLLYDNPASGNCHKVRLILSLLDIEFESRELSVVDHSDRAEVLGGLSPSLNVPTVVLEDGRPLAESNASSGTSPTAPATCPTIPTSAPRCFVGERFTIADIALYAYTHVAPEGGFDLEPCPAICGWQERVEVSPGSSR